MTDTDKIKLRSKHRDLSESLPFAASYGRHFLNTVKSIFNDSVVGNLKKGWQAPDALGKIKAYSAALGNAYMYFLNPVLMAGVFAFAGLSLTTIALIGVAAVPAYLGLIALLPTMMDRRWGSKQGIMQGNEKKLGKLSTRAGKTITEWRRTNEVAEKLRQAYLGTVLQASRHFEVLKEKQGLQPRQQQLLDQLEAVLQKHEVDENAEINPDDYRLNDGDLLNVSIEIYGEKYEAEGKTGKVNQALEWIMRPDPEYTGRPLSDGFNIDLGFRKFEWNWSEGTRQALEGLENTVNETRLALYRQRRALSGIFDRHARAALRALPKAEKSLESLNKGMDRYRQRYLREILALALEFDQVNQNVDYAADEKSVAARRDVLDAVKEISDDVFEAYNLLDQTIDAAEEAEGLRLPSTHYYPVEGEDFKDTFLKKTALVFNSFLMHEASGRHSALSGKLKTFIAEKGLAPAVA